MSATLIAIEGIDGAGKGTQTARLVHGLAASGARVALFSFPRYSHTLYGSFIGDYLNGRLGPLETIDPLLAALLFAGDRLESRPLLIDSLASHDYVICDRYVGSNIAYQAARRTGPERQQLLERIEAVEYGVNHLPRPDRTILLDLPVATAKKLIALKAKRVYTEQTEDLHEQNTGFLEAVRSVYQTLAEQPTWSLVTCEQDGRIRPIDEIADEIIRRVTE